MLNKEIKLNSLMGKTGYPIETEMQVLQEFTKSRKDYKDKLLNMSKEELTEHIENVHKRHYNTIMLSNKILGCNSDIILNSDIINN